MLDKFKDLSQNVAKKAAEGASKAAAGVQKARGKGKGDDEQYIIAVKIADGKVVSYAIEGAAFDVQYSAVTPTSVSFGDWDHYAVKLTRTSDTTAWELARGRDGYGSASLTKQ